MKCVVLMVMAFVKMLPHFDRSDAQTVFDTFAKHAVPKKHYALMYKSINDITNRLEPPAVRLFRTWFESLMDDPKMFGALSMSAEPGSVGALSASPHQDGALSLNERESP